jgi:hypothetical protein
VVSAARGSPTRPPDCNSEMALRPCGGGPFSCCGYEFAHPGIVSKFVAVEQIRWSGRSHARADTDSTPRSPSGDSPYLFTVLILGHFLRMTRYDESAHSRALADTDNHISSSIEVYSAWSLSQDEQIGTCSTLLTSADRWPPSLSRLPQCGSMKKAKNIMPTIAIPMTKAAPDAVRICCQRFHLFHACHALTKPSRTRAAKGARCWGIV